MVLLSSLSNIIRVGKTSNNFGHKWKSYRYLSSKISRKMHYDVIIAGGGIIGTTLACVLGKNQRLSNKSILLLEANKQKLWTVPEKYSNRVVSLNPSTQELLKNIGAWRYIENSRFANVKRLQVWEAISDASITFGEEYAAEDVSYIVENDLLIHAVSEEAKIIDNLDVFYNAKVKGYQLPEFYEDLVKINIDDGSQYTCDLLLGCDGMNSQVRKAMDVNYVSWSYNQMGIVATLNLSEDIQNIIAWQRFLPTGPIALLPLTSSRSSLVWSTTLEQAKELLKMSESEFVDFLNEAIYNNCGHNDIVDGATKAFDNLLRMMNCPSDTIRQYPPKIASIEEGSRAAFPLGFGHSTSYISKGAVLVGDAAHRIHPLAGQGVNLGFGDVICLNEILGKAAYSGSKLRTCKIPSAPLINGWMFGTQNSFILPFADDLSYLKEYETERQRHNLPTMLAVEGLHRLYNTDFTPVVLLRSLGLQATHVLDPLKVSETR